MQNTEFNTETNSQPNLVKNNLNSSKKVDVNILLNRVRAEKNNDIKKNLIITSGVVGALAVTSIIAIL